MKGMGVPQVSYLIRVNGGGKEKIFPTGKRKGGVYRKKMGIAPQNGLNKKKSSWNKAGRLQRHYNV